MAKKLWSICYKEACKAEPETYHGKWSWPKESKHPGRIAGWRAMAKYVLSHK